MALVFQSGAPPCVARGTEPAVLWPHTGHNNERNMDAEALRTIQQAVAKHDPKLKIVRRGLFFALPIKEI